MEISQRPSGAIDANNAQHFIKEFFTCVYILHDDIYRMLKHKRSDTSHSVSER